MKKNFTLIGIIALTSCASFPKSPKYFSPVLNNENIHVENHCNPDLPITFITQKKFKADSLVCELYLQKTSADNNGKILSEDKRLYRFINDIEEVKTQDNLWSYSIKIPKSDLSCYPGFTQIRVDWCTLREGGKIEKNAKDLAGWVSYAFTGKNPFYNIKKKIHQTQFIDIH